MPGVPGLPLDDIARRVGHCRWLEERCFEMLGGWVASTPEPEVKLLFARHSRHHAWHAELLFTCLPDTRDHDPDTLTAPAADGWPPAVDTLRAADDTLSRLSIVSRVLVARLAAEYDSLLDVASPVRDAPLLRWVGVLVGDERARWAESEALLATFDADRVADAAARAQAHLPTRG